MFLSRFGVKNYKCLGDIDIPLTPIHVLIGPNDSGKTSLMEAIEAFFASADRQVNEIFPKPWSGRELVRHGVEPGTISLGGQWSEAGSPEGNAIAYAFQVVFPEAGKDCRLQNVWAWHPGGARFALPSRTHNRTLVLEWREGRQPPPELENLELTKLSSVLMDAHRYSLDAKAMAVPTAIDPSRKFALAPDGFGLPTLLDDILGYDPERFIQLRKQFCELFPQFTNVRVESEANAWKRDYIARGEYQASRASGKGIRFETRSGQTIRAQQASDGAILFLGFLALAYVPERPSVLLIEEPENGIYPKRLDEVLGMLKDLSGKSEGIRLPQIIISTHSPYVLSRFEPEEVTFLSRPSGKPDEPVRARPMRDAPHIKERLGGGEFYLGELWYNLSEEELFGEPAGQRGP